MSNPSKKAQVFTLKMCFPIQLFDAEMVSKIVSISMLNNMYNIQIQITSNQDSLCRFLHSGHLETMFASFTVIVPVIRTGPSTE